MFDCLCKHNMVSRKLDDGMIHITQSSCSCFVEKHRSLITSHLFGVEMPRGQSSSLQQAPGQ